MLNRLSSRSDKSQQDIVLRIPPRIYKPSSVIYNPSHLYTADQLQELCVGGIYAPINNAEIMAMPDESTVDGFDTQMQTNPLSFSIDPRTLPLLEKGATTHGELHCQPFQRARGLCETGRISGAESR